MRQAQFRVHLQMAGEARLRIPPGIDNEPPLAATGGDVPAARAVARFAPGLPRHGGALDVQACVRA